MGILLTFLKTNDFFNFSNPIKKMTNDFQDYRSLKSLIQKNKIGEEQGFSHGKFF